MSDEKRPWLRGLYGRLLINETPAPLLPPVNIWSGVQVWPIRPYKRRAALDGREIAILGNVGPAGLIFNQTDRPARIFVAGSVSFAVRGYRSVRFAGRSIGAESDLQKVSRRRVTRTRRVIAALHRRVHRRARRNARCNHGGAGRWGWGRGGEHRRRYSMRPWDRHASRIDFREKRRGQSVLADAIGSAAEEGR